MTLNKRRALGRISNMVANLPFKAGVSRAAKRRFAKRILHMGTFRNAETQQELLTNE